MEMQCLTHMGTHKGYITFKRKSLLGASKALNVILKPELQKQNGGQ
jgi:hypothetical protein